MNEQHQNIPIKNIVNIIFKRKMIIITLFLSIVGTVTIGSFLIEPTFKAETKLLVIRDVEAEKAILLRINQNFYYDINQIINSEVEIIRSRPIAERVLEKLNLASLTVNQFMSRLSVQRLRESNIIEISYQGKERNMCAQIVNEWTKIYIEYRAELFRDTDAYEFFNEQIEVADKQLSELEQRQAHFQQEQALLSPDQQNQILLNKLSVYEQELTTARTERISRETSLAIIHNQLKNDSTTIIPSTETSDSPSQKDYLSRLKGELLSLEMERNRLLENYTPQYKDIVQIEKQIQATKNKIKHEVELIISQEMTAIKALKARENVLRSAISEIYSQMKERSQQEFKFSEISRGIDDSREVYSMLLKQREEARISLAKIDNLLKIRVVSPAVAPRKAVKPKKLLNILLSIFLGLGFGLGTAFVREYFDHSIGTTQDVETFLNLPVLTSIPDRR